MESKRQQKFSRLIKEELSDLFQREGLSFHNGHIVTITTVRVSPDLGQAKVFLSIFNSSNTTQVLADINVHNKDLRYKLGQRIRHQARVVPELIFFIDDTQEYAARIEKIFDAIAQQTPDNK